MATTGEAAIRRRHDAGLSGCLIGGTELPLHELRTRRHDGGLATPVDGGDSDADVPAMATCVLATSASFRMRRRSPLRWRHIQSSSAVGIDIDASIGDDMSDADTGVGDVNPRGAWRRRFRTAISAAAGHKARLPFDLSAGDLMYFAGIVPTSRRLV